jgi:flagellar transcriptional activator FlhD
MTAEQILAEIREANLSYLMLAQSLIRADASRRSTGSASATRRRP